MDKVSQLNSKTYSNINIKLPRQTCSNCLFNISNQKLPVKKINCN